MNPRRALAIAILVCGLCSWALAAAQQNLPPAPNPPRTPSGTSANDVLRDQAELDRKMAARVEQPTQNVPSTTAPGAPAGAAGDTAGLAAYHQAVNAYYRKVIADYDYTTTAFRWHQVSSLVILVVVLLVVGVGLYFSWLQFRRELEREASVRPASSSPTGGQPPAVPAAPEPPSSQVKLGAQGIEVNSSVLGVVILVVSLGFLYLYLAYVYPITIAK